MEASASLPRIFLRALLLAVLLATFTRSFVAQGVHIASGSMRPTLLPGDLVVVDKLLYEAPGRGLGGALRPSRPVRRYDVVVFRSPSDPAELLVKRCIGLPGEVLSIDHGRVIVDGRPLKDETVIAGATMAPLRIPDDHYFVLGDDRDASLDSRDLGPVPHSALVGRVLLVYWSYRLQHEGRALGPLRILRRLLRESRWERVFVPVR